MRGWVERVLGREREGREGDGRKGEGRGGLGYEESNRHGYSDDGNTQGSHTT